MEPPHFPAEKSPHVAHELLERPFLRCREGVNDTAHTRAVSEWKIPRDRHSMAERGVPTKNSEGVEKSGDLFRSAVMSPACSHLSRNSSHGSAVGFADAQNWSSRSLRSATNWPSCAVSGPDAPSFSRLIA